MELQELLDIKQQLATTTIYDDGEQGGELLDWLSQNVRELLEIAIGKEQNGKQHRAKGYDAGALVPAFQGWTKTFKKAVESEPTKAMRLFYRGCVWAFSICTITARELTYPSPGEELDIEKLDSVCDAFLTIAKTVAGSKERPVELSEDELPESVFDVVGTIQEASPEQLGELRE